MGRQSYGDHRCYFLLYNHFAAVLHKKRKDKISGHIRREINRILYLYVEYNEM